MENITMEIENKYLHTAGYPEGLKQTSPDMIINQAYIDKPRFTINLSRLKISFHDKLAASTGRGEAIIEYNLFIIPGLGNTGGNVVEKLKMLQHMVYHQNMIPSVRIRKKSDPHITSYAIAFKWKSVDGGLSRPEVQFDISEEDYINLLLWFVRNKPIEKEYRIYDFGGLDYEFNHVDKGPSTEFYYAEIEFKSADLAEAFINYLPDTKDITNDPSWKMDQYWRRTRTPIDHYLIICNDKIQMRTDMVQRIPDENQIYPEHWLEKAHAVFKHSPNLIIYK